MTKLWHKRWLQPLQPISRRRWHSRGISTSDDSQLHIQIISATLSSHDIKHSTIRSGWSKVLDSTGYLDGTTLRDWGDKVGDGKTWRTLSSEQWQYLFSYNNTTTGKDYRNSKRDGKYKFSVKVCDKNNCIILLLDVWNESVISLADFAKTGLMDYA